MKFICNGCRTGNPCILDVGDDSSVTLDSLRCALTDDHWCDWRKYEDGEVAKLQKLTAEVFNRPDCPELANYAAVDENGRAVLFEHRPTIAPIGKWWNRRVKYRLLDGRYDYSDWQNSLIEHYPQFPDWAEVGGYVYDERNGYGKIVSGSVKSCYIEFDGGAGDFVPGAFAKLKQARLRPYNAEEMKSLVGKIICEANASHVATTCIHHDGTDYLRLGIHLYDAEELISKGFTFDGKPCAILEHLENGEWVR